jgi:hypothetical protein
MLSRLIIFGSQAAAAVYWCEDKIYLFFPGALSGYPLLVLAAGTITYSVFHLPAYNKDINFIHV